MVLVDDASRDGTLEHLQTLQRELGDWVQIVSLTDNGGAAHARNVGWDRATQDYVAFLDADDAWHPRKLELQCDFMTTHPEVMLSGHRHRVLADTQQQSPQWEVPQQIVASPVTWSDLLFRHQFVTPSVMLRRDLPVRFVETMRYMEDYRLWLEVAAAPYKLAKLEVDLAAIYKPPFGTAGLSADLWPMELAELSVIRHFQQVGKLSTVVGLLLSLYSLIRYLRRMLIVWLRRILTDRFH